VEESIKNRLLIFRVIKLNNRVITAKIPTLMINISFPSNELKVGSVNVAPTRQSGNIGAIISPNHHYVLRAISTECSDLKFSTIYLVRNFQQINLWLNL